MEENYNQNEALINNKKTKPHEPKMPMQNKQKAKTQEPSQALDNKTAACGTDIKVSRKRVRATRKKRPKTLIASAQENLILLLQALVIVTENNNQNVALSNNNQNMALSNNKNKKPHEPKMPMKSKQKANTQKPSQALDNKTTTCGTDIKVSPQNARAEGKKRPTTSVASVQKLPLQPVKANKNKNKQISQKATIEKTAIQLPLQPVKADKNNNKQTSQKATIEKTAIQSSLKKLQLQLIDTELRPVKSRPNSSQTVQESKGPYLPPRQPVGPNQLQSLAILYHEEIASLQERLSQAMPTFTMIVANIQQSNKEPITQQVYELIHGEVVGWIGKYQNEGFETPIFLNITNHCTHISVVCEDAYAFVCVQRCVEEVSAQRSLSTAITVEQWSEISKQVNCYGAVYAGIITEPHLFIKQVKLHWPRLRADQWIVVAHDVCVARSETSFLLLMDEFSAMALKYYHNNKLFVCLHAVEFTNKGRLPLCVN